MVSNPMLKRLAAGVIGSRVLQPLGRPALRATQYLLGLTQREVVSFAQPVRAGAAARVREIVTQFSPQTVGVDEAYMIRAAVLATAHIPGVLAEVGVFRGGTARVICEAKNDRTLHLFDTFRGLPAPGPEDVGFKQGEYACSLPAVQAYLAGCQQVFFHPGLFPETSGPVENCRFSFVHLDVDLFESTTAALRFFYPRMNRGAMLISHDFVQFEAVHQAFDEFFRGTSQPVLELSGNQCLVVKTSD